MNAEVDYERRKDDPQQWGNALCLALGNLDQYIAHQTGTNAVSD